MLDAESIMGDASRSIVECPENDKTSEMTQADAIRRAAEFIGKSVKPESATFYDRHDGRRYWSIVYRMEAFLPDEEAKGVCIDGPYVLHVDDVTGEVSVLG